MEQEQSWDWQTPKKEIPVKEWEDNFSWTEEFQVSPDGEKIAAIVNKEEAVFTVCENGNIWEGEYEKAWSLKYSPDGRLAACVCKDEEWTVAVDGREWNTWFDYIWRLMFSSSGSHMGISVQKDMEYSMAVDDRIWDNLFDSLCESVISEDGRSAAVVQVESLGQADLEGFKKGIFSCAVNGSPLEGNYLNIWDISFNESGSQVAFAARLNRTDYTIVQEGQPWDTAFQTVWKPKFLNGGSCLAPVRKAGKWYLYKDGNPFWDKSYDQLWNLQITGDDQKIAAIVSESFGKWTVAQNDQTWDIRSDMMISDLMYSRNGSTLAALVKNKGNWTLVVNNHMWNLNAQMVFGPVISSNGEVVAAVIEKKGKYFLSINNKIVNKGFDKMFLPKFSPDNQSIMQLTIDQGIYKREIIPLETLL